MDIQIISFGLALLVGAVSYGLVRHTTQEFDRWYTDEDYRQNALRMRIPAVLVSVIVVSSAALLALFVR